MRRRHKKAQVVASLRSAELRKQDKMNDPWAEVERATCLVLSRKQIQAEDIGTHAPHILMAPKEAQMIVRHGEVHLGGTQRIAQKHHPQQLAEEEKRPGGIPRR